MAEQIIRGLPDLLKVLKELGPAAQQRGGPVRSALRKGGVIIRDLARDNVARIVAEPNQGGEPSKSTGALAAGIMVSRDPRPQLSGANERYTVRVKRKKAPNGQSLNTYGGVLEFGNAEEGLQPKPWLRPALEAGAPRALDVIVIEMQKGIERIARKLAKQRGLR